MTAGSALAGTALGATSIAYTATVKQLIGWSKMLALTLELKVTCLRYCGQKNSLKKFPIVSRDSQQKVQC
jgi:hypothetical protein